VVFLVVLVTACATKGTEQREGLSVEQLVRRAATELWTQGDLSIIPEVFPDTAIDHYGDVIMRTTHEETRSVITTWRTAFPDLEMVVEDLVISGDTAVARYTVTGTHLGELWGNEPTGIRFRIEQIYIMRVEDGKIAEAWGVWDQYGFRRQLGLTQ